MINDVCSQKRIDIITLFWNAGFNFKLEKRSTLLAYTPAENAILGLHNGTPDYSLIELLAEFSDLNLLHEASILDYDLSDPKMAHYLASIGVVTDEKRSKIPGIVQVYSQGKRYRNDYRNTISVLLYSLVFPTVLHIVIMDYLGKSLSIPPKEIEMKESNQIGSDQFDYLEKEFIHAENLTHTQELLKWLKCDSEPDGELKKKSSSSSWYCLIQ